MLFTTPVSYISSYLRHRATLAAHAPDRSGLLFTYDTAPRLRHTPLIGPGLQRLHWHSVGLSLKPPCTQNGPALDDIRVIHVHPQKIHTGVLNKPFLRHRCRKYVVYDTAPRSRHTPRIGQAVPRRCWHGVGLSLELSGTLNNPVRDKIRRVRVHPQNRQTGVVNKPRVNFIYDTATRSRYTPRIGQALPRLCWHGVGLSLKLSCPLNGPVFDEILHCFRVHPQNRQAVSSIGIMRRSMLGDTTPRYWLQAYTIPYTS